MKAPVKPHRPRAVAAKSAYFDSIPPPPVVSDQDAGEPSGARSGALTALLGWAFAPLPQGRFFRARVALLLTILAGVLLWASSDYYQRRARTAWHRPLNVALVLVEREPITPATIALLTERARDLEQRLASEYKRHSGQDFVPFSFEVTRPVKAEEPPPSLRAQSWLELVPDTYRVWRWSRDIDARAGIERSAYDARIYLVMKPAEGGLAFVEGESEFGGRIGIAQADIDPEMIDFSLFVASHELLHTLGASDKYDAAGRAVYPSGFAKPDKLPLFPQPGAEVMARNLPLSSDNERPPNTLSELFVGDATAREIGWRKP